MICSRFSLVALLGLVGALCVTGCGSGDQLPIPASVISEAHATTKATGETPMISFVAPNISAPESQTQTGLTVWLSEPAAEDVSVNYYVTGSAEADGVDYSMVEGPVTIAAGELAVVIPITIVDDLQAEAAETIMVLLDEPDNATYGDAPFATVTILDDDVGGSASVSTTPNAALTNPENFAVGGGFGCALIQR